MMKSMLQELQGKKVSIEVIGNISTNPVEVKSFQSWNEFNNVIISSSEIEDRLFTLNTKTIESVENVDDLQYMIHMQGENKLHIYGM